MALIIHRCECSHPDYFHERGVCSHKQCMCPVLRADTAPEVVPTWSSSTMQEVEEIVPPGTEWNSGNRHRVTMCDCTACRELYDSLGGVAA